jgi:hypothetical protein
MNGTSEPTVTQSSTPTLVRGTTNGSAGPLLLDCRIGFKNQILLVSRLVGDAQLCHQGRPGQDARRWRAYLPSLALPRLTADPQVIMDVMNAEQARVAEEAGACAVMALERIPSEIRKQGGVARMSDPQMIKDIMFVSLLTGPTSCADAGTGPPSRSPSWPNAESATWPRRRSFRPSVSTSLTSPSKLPRRICCRI